MKTSIGNLNRFNKVKVYFLEGTREDHDWAVEKFVTRFGEQGMNTIPLNVEGDEVPFVWVNKDFAEKLCKVAEVRIMIEEGESALYRHFSSKTEDIALKQIR